MAMLLAFASEDSRAHRDMRRCFVSGGDMRDTTTFIRCVQLCKVGHWIRIIMHASAGYVNAKNER